MSDEAAITHSSVQTRRWLGFEAWQCAHSAVTRTGLCRLTRDRRVHVPRPARCHAEKSASCWVIGAAGINGPAAREARARRPQLTPPASGWWRGTDAVVLRLVLPVVPRAPQWVDSTRTHNLAEFALPEQPTPGETALPNAQILTATAARWERLSDTAGKPCQGQPVGRAPGLPPLDAGRRVAGRPARFLPDLRPRRQAGGPRGRPVLPGRPGGRPQPHLHRRLAWGRRPRPDGPHSGAADRDRHRPRRTAVLPTALSRAATFVPRAISTTSGPQPDGTPRGGLHSMHHRLLPPTEGPVTATTTYERTVASLLTDICLRSALTARPASVAKSQSPISS